MKIDNFMLSLECDNKLKIRPDRLRGYFGRQFEEYALMHNHNEEGYFYRYPLVQYKILDGRPIILGIGLGAKVLKEIYGDIKKVTIDGVVYEIYEKSVRLASLSFGYTIEIIHYSFLTPWLALNEKNYEKYQKLGRWIERKELLESILIGNIISISKSLGYTVDEPITAKIIDMKEVNTRLKGTPMLGFLGTFSVNFEIPDYWGIGKSVSRGFGTIIRGQRTDNRGQRTDNRGQRTDNRGQKTDNRGQTCRHKRFE